MHLCPVVPHAENAMPFIVKSKSADGQTIAELFQPSSNRSLPNLFDTRGANSLPI